MFVPLQPLATPMTAAPGALLAPGDGASAVSSDAPTVGADSDLAPADAGHALESDVATVAWTGMLGPADAWHALTSDAAPVVRVALAPPSGGGRVTGVRGEAHVTGVPLS